MISFEKNVAIANLHVPVGWHNIDLAVLERRRRMLAHYDDRKFSTPLQNGSQVAWPLGIEMLRQDDRRGKVLVKRADQRRQRTDAAGGRTNDNEIGAAGFRAH